MDNKVIFELLEEEPNIIVGRVNGTKITGASSCRRNTGEYVELIVRNHDESWSGAITMAGAGGAVHGVAVAGLVVEGPRICPTCERDWPRCG